MSRRPTKIPAEWIVKEGNLPDNVTPENSKLKDPEERQRIARVFARGLTEPSGYVLPIQRWQAQASAGRVGAARNGRRAEARSILCRATARSAIACRSAPCPTCRRRRFPMSFRPIRPPRASRCPPFEAPQRGAQRVASFAAAEVGPGGAGAGRTDARRHQRRGAHRDLGRGARRAPQRVHAAGRAARGLSRADRRGRDGGGEPRAAAAHRGLSRRPSTRAST